MSPKPFSGDVTGGADKHVTQLSRPPRISRSPRILGPPSGKISQVLSEFSTKKFGNLELEQISYFAATIHTFSRTLIFTSTISQLITQSSTLS